MFVGSSFCSLLADCNFKDCLFKDIIVSEDYVYYDVDVRHDVLLVDFLPNRDILNSDRARSSKTLDHFTSYIVNTCQIPEFESTGILKTFPVTSAHCPQACFLCPRKVVKGIQCEGKCRQHFHRGCLKLKTGKFSRLLKSTKWCCDLCTANSTPILDTVTPVNSINEQLANKTSTPTKNNSETLSAYFNRLRSSDSSQDLSISQNTTVTDTVESSEVNFNCPVCATTTANQFEAIFCDGMKCERWFHTDCVGLSKDDVKDLIGKDWLCNSCNVPSEDVELPAFTPAADIFKAKWGCLKGAEIKEIIEEIQASTVSWKRNLFKLPSGASGKGFIEEVTRLIDLWVNKTVLESVSLNALQIFGTLMLQKPSRTSKNRDHIKYLKERLIKWKNGEFQALFNESDAIQKRMLQSTPRKQEDIVKVFTRLMLMGKIGAALKWVTDNNAQALKMTPEVVKVLQSKHPAAAPISSTEVISGRPLPYIEPVIFDHIDGDSVAKAAKKNKGAAGPSGMDSDCWKRILCSKSFDKSSHTACDAIARMCRRLCTEHVDPESIQGLLSCRLIPLDKNPGVRPIGIGEVLRRIIGSAVTTFLKNDIINAVGPLQLSAGQNGGCEAAVHAMEKLYNTDDCEGILLVNASNAFNSLNRATSLHNIQYICPELATYIINTYRVPVKLYLPDGSFIYSKEGTTQGDTAAPGFYSISTHPLIKRLSELKEISQIWYADDAGAGGKMKALRAWWDMLVANGPSLGYYPNAKKTWLVVKKQFLAKAKAAFVDTEVKITAEGQRYLGAAIGSTEFKESFVEKKIASWVKELQELTSIAKCEPQLAYCAYVFGLAKRWTYIMRTMKNISHLFRPLEDQIYSSFLPSIVNFQFSIDDRQTFSMPTKFGGLGIFDPCQIADLEYSYS